MFWIGVCIVAAVVAILLAVFLTIVVEIKAPLG
jgi:hypothetical protein